MSVQVSRTWMIEEQRSGKEISSTESVSASTGHRIYFPRLRRLPHFFNLGETLETVAGVLEATLRYFTEST